MATQHTFNHEHSSKFQRSKIIATIGPATDSEELVDRMLVAGVHGYRMNFSHGSYESFERQIGWIRKASREHARPAAIIQDIQGPKIRLGEIKDDQFEVHPDDELRLVYGAEHDGYTLPVQYDLSTKVKKGERVYIYDGRIEAVAVRTDPKNKCLVVRVENRGVVMSRKGINLPDTDFGGDILTKKDYEDIDWGADKDFDYVALSFVHSAQDIELLRGYLAAKGSGAQIIAKIETKLAVDQRTLEEIVEASDGVMVARGDLAIEIGPERVPVVQRDIISLCQKHAKISIVATQMMVSMVENPEPTRAEVGDVSSAVALGSDCLMVSEETAIGKYPIKTLQTMKRIITYTQEHVPISMLERPRLAHIPTALISEMAVELSERLKAQALFAETKSGATAHHLAIHRPNRPIISVTSDKRVAQQLALLYANKSFLRPDAEYSAAKLASELAETGYLKKPATVVIVSGQQPGVSGGTDTIKVRVIK